MIRLFRVFIPLGSLALLLGDVLLLGAAYVAASYITPEVDPTVYLLYDGGLAHIGVVVLSLVLALHFQDLYSQFRVKSRLLLAQRLSFAAGAAFLVQGFVSYVS